MPDNMSKPSMLPAPNHFRCASSFIDHDLLSFTFTFNVQMSTVWFIATSADCSFDNKFPSVNVARPVQRQCSKDLYDKVG